MLTPLSAALRRTLSNLLSENFSAGLFKYNSGESHQSVIKIFYLKTYINFTSFFAWFNDCKT